MFPTATAPMKSRFCASQTRGPRAPGAHPGRTIIRILVEYASTEKRKLCGIAQVSLPQRTVHNCTRTAILLSYQGTTLTWRSRSTRKGS